MEHIYAQQTENHEKRQAIACRRASAGRASVVEAALSNLKTIATCCRMLAVITVMVLQCGTAWGQAKPDNSKNVKFAKTTAVPAKADKKEGKAKVATMEAVKRSAAKTTESGKQAKPAKQNPENLPEFKESWKDNTGIFSRYHVNKWTAQGLYAGLTPQQEQKQYRTEHSKTFDNGDGTFSYMYIGDLHYKDANGSWQDIEVNIEKTNNGPYRYANTKNKFRTYYSDSPSEGIMMKYLSKNLVFAKDYRFEFLDAQGNAIKDKQRTSESAHQDDYRTLSYRNFYSDIDYNIIQLGRGVETGFSVKSRNAVVDGAKTVRISQTVELPQGAYVVADGKKQGKTFSASEFEVMIPGRDSWITFQPVVVYDAHVDMDYIMKRAEIRHVGDETGKDGKPIEDPMAKYSYKALYNVSQSGNILTVSFDLPTEWMLASERAFPLFIDPTVTVLSGTTSVTSYYTFYNTYYHDSRWDVQITDAEMMAAGINNGATISACGLLCSAAPGRTVEKARIDLNNTAWTNGSWVTTGWTNCYYAASLATPTVSTTTWNTYTFQTNFTYSNANSNLLVRLSKDGTGYTSGGGNYCVSSTTGTTARGGYQDNSGGYPFNSISNSNNAVRPAMQLTYTNANSSCSHTEQTVGTHTTGIYQRSPVAPDYNYSYTQSIYTPEDVCGSSTGAKLYGIAFYYYGRSSYGTGGDVVRNVTIYLSETSNGQLTDWETTSLTQVYSGNVAFIKGGWTWITFQTPFDYSGNNNLVVTVNDLSGHNYWDGSGEYCYFYTDDNNPDDGTTRTRVYSNDNTSVTSPNSPPGTSSSCYWLPYTKFCIAPCEKVEVGDLSATTTNANLPSHSYYKYSLTQQIYTPCEIGVSGTLSSISFYNGGSAKTRTLDIYLVNTTKTTFANTSDWITVTASDRVFSGSVTMAAGDWTTINFNTPFVYNGTSNLAVIVDDNTGGYNSGMACRVYPADGNQAIYQYSDSQNNDPSDPSYTGTLTTVKNQLKFNVCDKVDLPGYTITATANPAAGGTATVVNDYGCRYTVTATANECYRFVNWTEGGTEVSTDATYSFTATSNRTLVANFEIRTVSITCGAENLIVGRTTTYSVSGEGLTDGQVTWSYSGTGSVSFSPTTGLSTTVTATSAGSGTITATISSCGGSVHTCTLSMIEVCDDPDTANVGDHSGTETHVNLPSQSYYNYSLTQQIYKPCEIGKRGTITSIALYNGGSAKTRTYDIYLKTTANNTFANTTAWIPVTAADRVFSGSVTMAAGAWTVIEFDVPFTYDGTSNLAVIMDDNTGGYSSGMSCRVYNADGNQAIYICSDGTNYNPLTDPITYSGTLTNKKNQIKFSVCDAVDIPASNYTVTVSANPTAGGTVTSEDNKCDNFTVTATPNDCYRFVNWTEGGTEVSTDATYSFTATSNRALVANFEAYSLSLTSDPDPLTCLASGTEVVLTASTDIPAAGGTYAFTNTTSSFSSISGSPDGTSSNTGDYATYAFSLPFDFILAGKSFASGTTLTMRCDGFVTFGSTWSTNTPSGPGSTYSVISPLGYDQNLISGESYMYYKVTGSVGSRVLTMEWKNMRSYFNTSSQYNWTNYQVKLYECSNMIELCYGSFTHNYTSTSVYIYLTADGKITNLTSITSPNISTNSTGTTSSISIGSSAAAPASGTVYQFTPPAHYTWTYTGTAGTANCNTYTVSPTQNSSYTVSVSGDGCTNKTATVNVSLQLEATIEIGD